MLAVSCAKTLLTAGDIGLSLRIIVILTASGIWSTAASTDLLSTFLDNACRLQSCVDSANHEIYHNTDSSNSLTTIVQSPNPLNAQL